MHKTRIQDFDAIKIILASPDEILSWSKGEIIKPETINYRTQKPEEGGLFCERIFGPVKDWECACGKYKKIRYKGIICDKCGVEVTRAQVRRERMGHIKLAAPVSHIWFLRGVPSKIGLVLDLSVQQLEKVIYFASFVITSVDQEAKENATRQLVDEYKLKKAEIQSEAKEMDKKAKYERMQRLGSTEKEAERKKIEKETVKRIKEILNNKDKKLKELDTAMDEAKSELKELEVKKIISEPEYHSMSLKYGHVFEAGIGAEVVRSLLEQVDLDKEIAKIDKDLDTVVKSSKKKLVRRMKVMKGLMQNKIRPEWMILTNLPVIPPDLRPMVELDGGRFATSDLNDLYRRVINRNNRLRRLKDIDAPEVIQRNEKRMLQEAVDALIDSSARRGKTVMASTGQRRQLKSLADILKGKQGRFRQNLLGKRVDYSGRSVIVNGPNLKMSECGLPKVMALELFKPFLISKLIDQEYAHNVRSANRFIESKNDVVWALLEDVVKNNPVLLNRAPTLHRLGIQAFYPKLIEGKAIRLHPLVCSAFNADFDGDQMAVHALLTKDSKREARELMLATNNLLKPATGDPVASPALDIAWGIYYLTSYTHETKDLSEDKLKLYYSDEDAVLAYNNDIIGLRDRIKIYIEKELVVTSVGRLKFNKLFPDGFSYINDKVGKPRLKELTSKIIAEYDQEIAVNFLDDVKDLGYSVITESGWSWGMDDLEVPEEKHEIIKSSDKKIDELIGQYEMGLLTEDEKHMKVIEIWQEAKDKIAKICEGSLDPKSPVYSMIDSKSRGSWAQLVQMMGMRGLQVSPSGDLIEVPVKASFKEGLGVLEYFISTHGVRKGLSDTALRTASAGYLTRRLVDVSQDAIIKEEDCGTAEGIVITKGESEEMGENLASRLFGRTLLQDVSDKKGKVLFESGHLITSNDVNVISKLDLDEVKIRSVMMCNTKHGVCQKCYGFDLGRNRLVGIGQAVGIVAAQSIGEPGTQLTMRTFHTGGVAGTDITRGLPRVEEIFEARPIAKAAILAPVAGKVKIINAKDKQTLLRIYYSENVVEEFKIPKSKKTFELKVKDGQSVKIGDVLARKGTKEIEAPVDGVVKIEENKIILAGEKEDFQEFQVPVSASILVKNGELIARGQQLSDGSIDLHDLYELRGFDAIVKYILKEIQYIYSSQGQKLSDKHIELIIKQMFSRVYIKSAGDTDLIEGEISEKDVFDIKNKEAKENGKELAVGERLLLGITRVSITTESFLSAASFQQTARVLIDAAVLGKVDTLRGLKENVIIGKLIPAGTGVVPLAAKEDENEGVDEYDDDNVILQEGSLEAGGDAEVATE